MFLTECYNKLLKYSMGVTMKIDVKEFGDYIKSQSKQTKIYFGADSERVNVDGEWWVDYLLVVAVHIDGKHGAKVFGEIHRERDFDRKLDKPKLRLMTEVVKIAELYEKLYEHLYDLPTEIHLDLNPDIRFGSSCAVSEAIGYIKGVVGIDPVVKPDAWAASICADRLKTLNG
jgi:predicted RNase H-related nuclease YkuK (DUF458 family)